MRAGNALILLLFAGLLALPGLAGAAMEGPIAITLKTSGDVQHSALGDTVWSALSYGDVIEDSGRVKTGEDGFTAIAFTDDGSQVKIREDAQVQLHAGRSATGTVVKRVLLEVGDMLADARRLKGDFDVVTPTSVASVKGTQFWTMVDEDGTTTVTTTEGQVELTNTISNSTVTVDSGQTATSSPDGSLDVQQTGAEEAPELEEPEDEGTGEGGAAPAPPGPPPGGTFGPGDTDGESDEGGPETGMGTSAGGTGASGFNMNGAAGATVIDGTTYQYFSFRPDISLGKFGVGLDLPIYMDAEGNIREEDWDEASDVIDKIFYLRWARPGDPFYARAGALTNLTLGYGLIMKRYNNAIEWPQVRRIGLHSQVNPGPFGFEAMVGNFKDLTGTETVDGPGLIGARATYELKLGLPIVFGANAVYDGNQYLGAPDEDDDGTPNAFDRFPGEDDQSEISTAWNIIGGASPTAQDSSMVQQLIAQGYLPDILSEYPTLGTQSVTIVGADLGIPIIRKEKLGLTLYGQYAKILGEEIDDPATPAVESYEPGSGYTVPGVAFNIGPLRLGAEYRIFSENFLPEFFNYSYDVERVTWNEQDSTYVPKYLKLAGLPSASGYYADIGFNIVNMVDLYAAYQQIAYDDASVADANKSIFGRVKVNTEPIPKLGLAEAYYQQPNAPDVFDLDADGTTIGYRLGLELSPGFMLVYDNKAIYRDGEPNRIMTIETQLAF